MAAAFVSAETPEEEIRRAITQLGDDDPKKRDAAEELLREIGPEAVLLYRPGEQGKDPEIRRRMNAMLLDWEFGGEPDSVGVVRNGPRIRPWVSLEAAVGYASNLEDDRLPAYLPSDLRENHYGSDYLKRVDVPLTPELMKAALSATEFELRQLCQRPNLDMPEESKRLLLEFLHAKPPRSDRPTLILKWRMGERDDLLAELSRTDFELGREYDALCSDSSFCDAVGRAFGEKPMKDQAADRFLSASFADFYVEMHAPETLSCLESEVAAPRLRKLLQVDSARFRAAIGLAALGQATADLEGWDKTENWEQGAWIAYDLSKIAPQLPGERVEAKLRRLVEDPNNSADGRFGALRALGARKRPSDITFIYERLKELPFERQADVAVDLARLGSSAGVGILVPRLYGTGWAIRRDANKALMQITGQDFGYDPAGTLPERCRAARKWAIWWRENKTSFHPDVK